jgi:hypothetical protein
VKIVGATWSGEVNPAEWAHFSMVREENNTVRWTVNGLPVVPAARADAEWGGPLEYDQFGLGGSVRGKCVFDLDEFCLFDRALTGDEIAKLAAPAR